MSDDTSAVKKKFQYKFTSTCSEINSCHKTQKHTFSATWGTFTFLINTIMISTYVDTLNNHVKGLFITSTNLFIFTV